MCKVMENLMEAAEARGKDAAEKKILLNLFKKGLPSKDISDILERSIAEVEQKRSQFAVTGLL